MLGGFILFIIGALIWLGGRIGLPLGRLPGDIHIEGEHASFHFPVVTSILASILLTIFLNLIARLLNK